MKRLIKAATSIKIPEPFNKYYYLGEDADVEAVYGPEVVDGGYPCEEANGYRLEHLNWVIAKDEYFEDLANKGIDIVELVKDESEEVYLAYVINDRVYKVEEREMPKDIDAATSVKCSEDGHGRNSQGQTWQEWLDSQFWEGFNPSDLEDEEFYELEDAFYKS